MRGARTLLIGVAALGAMPLAHAGNARGNFGMIRAGDSPLQAKCRSEAALIGGGHGKGAVQRAMETREIRSEYFKKCVHDG